MIGKDQPLALVNLLLMAFGGGIVGADTLPISVGCLLAISVVLFSLSAGLFLYNYRQAQWLLVAVFFCLGALRYSSVAIVPAGDISQLIGSNAIISGQVCATPQQQTDAAGLRIRYVVAVRDVKIEQHKLVSGKIIVYSRQSADKPIARYGDEIKATGEIRALRGYRNPGLVDTVATLERQGIGARLQAVKNSVVVRPNPNFFLQRQIDKLRDDLLTALNQAMSPQDAATLFALLFGGYAGIKPELLAAFTATGIVHILSVSGSHIALLAGTLQQLGEILHLRKDVTALIIVGAIVAYALLSGLVPPVVRSAIMGILTFVALTLGREKIACRILALVGLAMLIMSPRLIYDISFQLSFGATAGLLYIAPLINGWLNYLPKWLAANLALTIAAQVSVLPVLAWYFNMVSLSALAANLVVVPVVEYIIILGLFSAVIGVILPFVQNIFFVLCSLLLGLVYNITSLLAAIPGGNLYLPSGGRLWGMVYYAGLFGIVYNNPLATAWSKWRDLLVAKPRIVIVGVVAALGVIGYFIGRPALVRVHFIDVGQGDAALITTPHGQAVLVDTGGVLRDLSDFDIGQRVVLPYLRHYGVLKLDYLILTHAHDDHAGGAATICKQIPVNHIVIGHEDRQAYARVFRTSVQQLPDTILAYTGQNFQVDGVEFRILQAMDAPVGSSGNEVSNVIQIVYGTQRCLITGDLEANGEMALLQAGANLPSDVLKVAHHGSKTSSTAAFIRAVNPKYAVISVGADNQFGHPSNAVIERLVDRQAQIYRTDRDGAIVMTTDGKTMQITTFMKNR